MMFVSPPKCGPFLLATIMFIHQYNNHSPIKAANAFQCYVCDSKVDIGCIEELPKNSRLTPKNCNNITDAKYCIKTTNIYAGEFGTKRFCAANDHGNHCDYIKQPTGDREYRSCVYTCDSEGCNRSESLLNKQYIIYVASISTLISYFLVTILTCNRYT